MKSVQTVSPIYLGFASQKGGVGKSSLAEVLASILYYEKGIPLAVVDCDGTQESFYKLRERERNIIDESPDIAEQLKAFFTKFGKRAYTIFRTKPEEALIQVKQLLTQTEEDIRLVIFDFPGHAGTTELLNLSLEMDYIISPIEADPQSLVSSFAYAKTVRDLGISLEDARIQDLLLLWNKINRSASTVVIDHYSDYAKSEDINLFDTRIYHSVKFARELAQGGVKGVFRSSYLPPVASLRTGTGVNEWVEEVCRRFKISTE